jgi:uncharacterized protein with HEPN domain
MSRGVALLLGEVLEAIRLIEQYTHGLSLAAFSASIEKQDAVARRLAVIGEAMKGVPDEFRARYPDVPWAEVARTNLLPTVRPPVFYMAHLALRHRPT